MVSIPRKGGNFGHSFNVKGNPYRTTQTSKKRGGTSFKKKAVPPPILTSQQQPKDLLRWTGAIDEGVDAGVLPGMRKY
jgi:hypothetical protein